MNNQNEGNLNETYERIKATREIERILTKKKKRFQYYIVIETMD